MQKVSGKILLTKDPDFHVLCFDLNIDSFYPARVHFWPQNHPTNPPKPDLSLAASSSDMVTISSQTSFSLVCCTLLQAPNVQGQV